MSVEGLLGADLWAMDHRAYTSMVSQLSAGLDVLNSTLLSGLERDLAVDETERPYVVAGGTAQVELRGVMMRTTPWLFRLFGIHCANTVDIGRALRAADSDPDVSQIVLAVDSPGGTVAGTEELAEIYSGLSKPTLTRVDGMMASAATWVGVQGDKVTASGKTSEVGSIGVYSIVADTSRAASDAGVDVIVTRSSELKGIGVPGGEVSKNQRADLQRGVDDAFKLFRAAVARGRDMSASEVAAVATGQTWYATEALAKNLIDSIAGQGEDTRQSGETKQETSMSNKPAASPAADTPSVADNSAAELEAVKAELAQAKALAAAKDKLHAEALRESDKAACMQILDASDRITPAIRESAETVAKAADYNAEALKSFLAGLPRQTRPEQRGASGAQPNTEASADNLDAIAEQIQAANPGMNYFQAYSRACEENTAAFVAARAGESS